MTREERSIILLKTFEPKSGYHLAFSGGKDSQILYDIALKAGVKFIAYFCRTSVDPPEVIKFIKENYPEVVFLKPKMTMYQSIIKNKILPMRQRRFCCKDLKEYAGTGEVTLTGIRSAESNNRKLRLQVELDMSKMKLMIHPLKDWSDRQVWNYLKRNKIKVNPLYEQGFGRIGCIGCPMPSAGMKQMIFMKYPKHKVAYLNTIQKLLDMNLPRNKRYENAEDMFNWWVQMIQKMNTLRKKIR